MMFYEIYTLMEEYQPNCFYNEPDVHLLNFCFENCSDYWTYKTKYRKIIFEFSNKKDAYNFMNYSFGVFKRTNSFLF